jgi:hypothetical protein
MATEFVHGATTITKVAGADLTGSQCLFVKLDGSGNAVPITAATDVPYGLLLNAPASGQEAHIAVEMAGGRAIASAAISLGATLGVSATGAVVAIVPGTDTTKYIVGKATKEAATASPQVIQIQVACLIPRLAAN